MKELHDFDFNGLCKDKNAQMAFQVYYRRNEGFQVFENDNNYYLFQTNYNYPIIEGDFEKISDFYHAIYKYVPDGDYTKFDEWQGKINFFGGELRNGGSGSIIMITENGEEVFYAEKDYGFLDELLGINENDEEIDYQDSSKIQAVVETLDEDFLKRAYIAFKEGEEVYKEWLHLWKMRKIVKTLSPSRSTLDGSQLREREQKANSGSLFSNYNIKGEKNNEVFYKG